MRRHADVTELRRVLCAGSESGLPAGRPDRLGLHPEGSAPADGWDPERPTLLGGVPQGPSSPAPGPLAVTALREQAARSGIGQILVPYVRRSDDTGPLRAAGFTAVAAGSEGLVRLPGEVADVLRGRVGERRFGELRARHAEHRELSWEPTGLGDLSGRPEAREAFAALHRRETGRGALWTAEALDALARGPLADRTELLLRRRGGDVVQAGLLVRSYNGRGIHSLTQALAPDTAAARQALYEASLYELYLHARRTGLEWVHLGPGDAERMRALGADHFVALDHWLSAPDLKAGPEQPPEPAEIQVSAFATEPVAAVPVPGPARFRGRPKFDLLDLSGNTNPFLGADGRYPELDTAELARTYLSTVGRLPGHTGLGELGPEWALFTSGAVDAVMLLLAALAAPGDAVCVTPPTFELYAHFARVLRLPVVEAPLLGEDLTRLDVERILSAGPRVTFLCDPNNPVGTRLDREQVLDLITRSRGLVVIDEAYVEFSAGPSYAPLVARHDNLIVLRTLSKAWGLAGARCGVALAQPGLVEALRRVQVPFGFTGASQRAVRDRLTDSARVLDSVRRILAERDRMARELARHPAVERVFPSEANFLLVRTHRHEHVMERLRDAGIMVADTARLVPGTCRVSIADERANDTLLDALSTVQ
ncbi:pyridoxal phosphate-dependent aminotransferase [Streptomyces sp. NPDC059785]|uniref:pyridoxal phosphate-dependent aminotransferase n=1 Tax=Streptomyces sp. NPDC059785 TaxID=3346945 RepID=UPI0036533B3E